MPKWIVPNKQKIDIDIFKVLFYEQRKTIKEISNYFNCHVSSISSFRKRWNLPTRGWGKCHPMQGLKHSKESKNKISNSRKGITCKENNPNWKGGEYINRGYKYIRVPEDTIDSYRGYIREHRYVMSNHLGRPLNISEHIHHIDGNKLNNNISNLTIMTNSEHLSLHYPKGSKFGKNC